MKLCPYCGRAMAEGKAAAARSAAPEKKYPGLTDLLDSGTATAPEELRNVWLCHFCGLVLPRDQV